MTSGWSVVSVEPVGLSKVSPSAPRSPRACAWVENARLLDDRGARRAVDCLLGAAQQRLAEHPALEEVQVLLAAHRILDGEQGVGGRLGGRADLHLEEVGLGEVLQPWRAACAANSWK